MKAVRFHGQRDVRFEDVAEPGPLAATDVLIAPRFTGICGTDVHEYFAGPIVTSATPHPMTGASIPQILGHEFTAVVIAVGEDVMTATPGDRVAVMPIIYCGRCYYCARGLGHLCNEMAAVGLSSPWGAMAELAVVGEQSIVQLPDSITFEQGALIEPAAVALYAVDRSRLLAGESVLVTGGGPIGALAALAAAASGAGAVYVSEPNSARAKWVESLSVTRVFDPTAEDVAAELADLHHGVGVDVGLECSGNEAAFNTCVASVRKQGRVVQAGLFVKRASVDPMAWALKDLTIEATWCNPVWYFPRVAELIASGRLPVEHVITNIIGMQDVVEGFEALMNHEGDDMKILVSMDI